MSEEVLEEKQNLPAAKINYKKSNILISSKFSAPLFENKLMAILFSKISDMTFDPVRKTMHSIVYASEIKEIIGGNEGSFYQSLADVSRTMAGRVIGMQDYENKSFSYIPVIIRADYKNGVLDVEWNYHLNSVLTNLNGNFSILNLELMCRFKTTWAFRLYEILNSRSYNSKYEDDSNNQFTFYYNLAELRFEMGVANADLPAIKRLLEKKVVTDKDYEAALEIAIKANECVNATWGDFKRRILEPALKEINNSPNSKIHVSYKPDKGSKGGKVKGLLFTTTLLEEKNQNDESDDNKTDDNKQKLNEDEIFDEAFQLLSGDFNSREVKSILKAANNDLGIVKNAYKVIKEYKGPIKEPIRLIISAINERWESSKPKKQKDNNAFNNFPQNEYDFTELEKKLVSN